MTSINLVCAFFVFVVALASARNYFNSQEKARDSLRKLAIANNELAFNLHRELASKSSENVFFSPLSVSTVLGMLFHGARGDTSEELRKALGYEKADLPNDYVHKAFNLFLREVSNTKDSSAGYTLMTSNAVLVDKLFELLEKYRKEVSLFYKAPVQNVCFAREAHRIVDGINCWVKARTNGKIEKLFETLSPSTLMVLLNAVYFKGTWKVQFDPRETTEEIFFNNGLESEGKKVPMMHMTSRFLSDSADDYHAVELPYKGGNISMLILLPNEPNGLSSLEDSMTPEKLVDIQERLEPAKIDVSIPRFQLEFEDELSREMQALGANRIFGGDADFSGMTRSRGLFVNEIRHKAVIEVNEEGSEAAAVTGVIIDRMKSPNFRADHPFLFAIIEKRSNMILFLGRVNNL